jgi:two-component system sensor histidine kinase RegB
VDNTLLSDHDEAERLPEEAALLTRLRVFVNLRWLAILCIIIATIVASEGFNISFPTLPVYITCAIIALYNLVLLREVRGLELKPPGTVIHKARIYGYTHIFLDLITLTVILHYTGGVENPFIFVYVLHIIAASIVLPYKTVYLLATSAIIMVALLVGLEYADIIQHHNLTGFVMPGRYRRHNAL